MIRKKFRQFRHWLLGTPPRVSGEINDANKKLRDQIRGLRSDLNKISGKEDNPFADFAKVMREKGMD